MSLQLEQSYVAEFSEAYGFEKQNRLTLAFIKQRYDLFIEEYKEFIKAINQNDRKEMLDALCDTKYIVLGTFHLLNQDARIMHTDFSFDMLIFKSKYKQSISNYLYVQARLLFLIETKAIELGFEKVFKEAFKRVHLSNMSKFCDNLDTVHKTMSQPKYKNVSSMAYIQRGGKYYVTIGKNDLELAVGKLIKSIDYNPVDLSDLV
jgi:predicted HAD superfamily Cof-like phosphohydrolase